MDSKKTFVLVAMDPYETGEVSDVIGPFDSIVMARVARANLLKKGAHPDHEFYTMELQTVNRWLESNQGILEEEDEPGDRDDDDAGHEAYQEGIQRELDNMDEPV